MAKKRGRQAGRGNNTRAHGTAPGKRTPRGHTSTAAKHESIETMTAAMRREKAVELHIFQRLSLRQIKERLLSEFGYQTTEKTLSLDLNAALDEANANTVRNMQHGQAMSALRLDQLDRQLVPIALGMLPPGKSQVVGRGKERKVIQIPMDGAEALRLRMTAIEQLRKNDESRRKLFGFDAKDEGGFSAEQVARLLTAVRSDLLELVQDPETRRAIAQALHRRSGLLSGAAVIDVPSAEAQPAGA